MANFPCPLPVDQLLEMAHQELSVLEAHDQGVQSLEPAQRTRKGGRATARPFLPSRRAASAPSAPVVRQEQGWSAVPAQTPKSEQQEDIIEAPTISMPDTLKQLVDQSEPLPPGSLLPDFDPIAPPIKTMMNESRSSSKQPLVAVPHCHD